MCDDLTRPTMKRKINIVSPLEKLRAIKEVELGDTKASVARRFNVPESTLRGWVKAKDKILLASNSKISSEDQRPSKRIKLEEIKAESKIDSASKEPDMDHSQAALTLQQANLLISAQLAAAATLPVDSWETLWYFLNQSSNQNLINELQSSSNSSVSAGTTNSTMPAEENVDEAAQRATEALTNAIKFLRWLITCSNPLVKRHHVDLVNFLLNSSFISLLQQKP